MQCPNNDRRKLIKMAGVGVAAHLVGANAFGAIEARGAGDSTAVSPTAPLQTEFVFEAEVMISPAVEIGPSAHGTRRYIPITGGALNGPKIRGTVLPGGADWQTDRADGVTELDALYSIKTNDGAVIIVRNRGLLVDGGAYFRTAPQFEAPRGQYEWLNKSIFVGSVAGSPHPGAVVVRIFRVI